MSELLTPRLMKMLAAAGVRYCVGLHDRMPEVERQEAALKALDGDTPGPLVVRWNLHRGFLYQAAKQRYEPFDRLVDEDPETRRVLARMAADAFKAKQKVWITANNKAEGSAPLSLLKLAEEIAKSAGLLEPLILLATCNLGAKPLEPRPLRTRVCGRRGDIPPLAPVSSEALAQEDDARGGPTGKGDTAWLCRHSPCASCWKPASISATTPGAGTRRWRRTSSACATTSTSSTSPDRAAAASRRCSAVRDVVAGGGRVLFVGTKRPAAERDRRRRQALRPVLRQPPLARRHADQLEDHLRLDQAPARARRAARAATSRASPRRSCSS